MDCRRFSECWLFDVPAEITSTYTFMPVSLQLWFSLLSVPMSSSMWWHHSSSQRPGWCCYSLQLLWFLNKQVKKGQRLRGQPLSDPASNVLPQCCNLSQRQWLTQEESHGAKQRLIYTFTAHYVHYSTPICFVLHAWKMCQLRKPDVMILLQRSPDIMRKKQVVFESVSVTSL